MLQPVHGKRNLCLPSQHNLNPLSAPLNLRRKKQQKKRRKSRTFPAYRNRARNRLRLLNRLLHRNQNLPRVRLPNQRLRRLPNLRQRPSVWGDVAPAAWGQAYGTITCDAIGLNASLIWGDDQSLLNQRGGVYQYPGSYQVGVTGGHLLCSHNDSVFSLLQYVSIGDYFVVDTDYGEYVYSVTLAKPGYVSSDASTVIADDGTVLVNFTDGIDKLIMYTCYPFDCYSPTNQRYVVQAVLQA